MVQQEYDECRGCGVPCIWNYDTCGYCDTCRHGKTIVWDDLEKIDLYNDILSIQELDQMDAEVMYSRGDL